MISLTTSPSEPKRIRNSKIKVPERFGFFQRSKSQKDSIIDMREILTLKTDKS